MAEMDSRKRAGRKKRSRRTRAGFRSVGRGMRLLDPVMEFVGLLQKLKKAWDLSLEFVS